MGSVKQWQLENEPLDHLRSEHWMEVEDTYLDLVEHRGGEWQVKWAPEGLECFECEVPILEGKPIFWHTGAQIAIHGKCICNGACS